MGSDKAGLDKSLAPNIPTHGPTHEPDAAAQLERRHDRGVLLVVDGITKRYGKLEAVRNVSFSVGRGELFTLLGPSGCGKSTTLMAIAGFETPNAGTVLLDGVDITNDPPEARGMGVVFQNYALFPHMSALDNVMFPLCMRDFSRKEAEQRSLEALDLVQLPNPQARPNQLSGGQMQRVALARALVFDPVVLLMDEPLAALDRRLRQDLQFEIRRIQSRLETTVVYVTHDQEEALVLSERIAVMRDGRFEQVGTPRDIYNHPANAFVANFLGESNTLEVEVVGRDGNEAVVAAGAQPHLRFNVPQAPAGLDQALLVLRPEDVQLVDDDGISLQQDSCEATVTDIAFLGDHVRVEVSVFDAATTWTVRTSPRGRSSQLKPGSKARLSWLRANARLVEL